MSDGPSLGASGADDPHGSSYAASFDAHTTTLMLRGELDARAVPDPVKAVDGAMVGRQGSLSVDLAQVSYLPSVAVGVLVEALRRVRGGGTHPGVDCSRGLIAAAVLRVTGVPHTTS